MATRTISASGGTRAYSDTATWDEAAVPTSADDVVARADGTSGNVTIGAAVVCRSADFTHYSGTLTHQGFSWTIGDASGGALTFVGTMTYTISGSPLIKLASTSNNGGTGWPVSFAGKTLNNLQFNGVGGKWVLQDSGFTSGQFFVGGGAVDTNSKSFTINGGNGTSTSGTNVRSLTLGTSVVSITGLGSTALDFSANTNFTLSAASSTLNISTATASFKGGGLTYGTVNFTGTGVATITGANTFGTLTRSNAAAVTLTLPASTTTTATTITLNGTVGNLVTLNSSSAGTAATLSVAAGAIVESFMSIKDSTATGGATFRAEQSTNVSGNTGWTFGPLFGGTTAGVSAVTNAVLKLALSLAGSTAGTSTATGDINWVNPGKGGIGG